MSDVGMFLSTIGAIVALGGVLYALMRGETNKLAVRMDGLDERLTTRIDELDKRLTTRIESLGEVMNAKFETVNHRLDNLERRWPAA
jgi:hypothetical protein